MITEFTYVPYRFQHASAVCGLGKGALVAFYAGLMECHESQHVCLAFNGEIIHELEPYTGNPVLFARNHAEAVLIYSKFEDLPANRIKWWQHCTLWSRRINISENGLPSISEPKQIIVDAPDLPTGKGLLTRCHPIKASIPGHDGEKWCLPVYREHDPLHHGFILISEDGLKWEVHSQVGGTSFRNGPPIRCIQPTIWKQNGELHTLMRNFDYGATGIKMAYHSRLDRNGNWLPLLDSTLYNFNNSLVVMSHNDRNFVLWNHDKAGRGNLCLGQLNAQGTGINDFKGVIKIANYGHYPSMAIIDEKLHILFTTSASFVDSFDAKLCIKHRVFDLKSIEKFLEVKTG